MPWISKRNWEDLIYRIEEVYRVVQVGRRETLDGFTLVRQRFETVTRAQRRLEQAMASEKELSQQLLAGLEETNTELDALDTVITNLVTVVGNQSDVSPEVQAALDAVAAQKSKIIAMALKGTPSAPQVPVDPEQPQG